MKRRDFFKGLAASAVAVQAAQSGLGQQSTPAATPPPPPVAPGPLPWMRGLLDVKALPIQPLAADAFGHPAGRFFSETRFASLLRLCEIFEPAVPGYPGALEAGTPEFLDFLLGASPKDRKQMYEDGLDRLESEAQTKFGIPFSRANAEQADTLIRPWLRTWMSDHPPTEAHARFINLAHSDIREATMHSQAWSDAAHKVGKSSPGVDLYWYPVDPNQEAIRKM